MLDCRSTLSTPGTSSTSSTPHRGSTPRHRWRAGAVLLCLALGGLAPAGAGAAANEAYAPNCVNVVLRDPFWGQFRRAIESGGDAAGVPGALARAGFAVTGSPSVGAVVSWPAGAYGASTSGHVGIVEAVRADGSVLVRHENWPYGAREHVQAFTVRAGFQFVHRPDVVAAGPPAPPGGDAAAAAAAAAEAPGQRTHTVRPGDTLYGTARAHGTTVDALVAAHGLGSPDTILPVGLQLLIP